MRLIALLIGTLLTISVQAKDYGDKNCNIFITSAQNVITGGWGNYYSIKVKVTKNIIEQYYKDSTVSISYDVRGEWITTSESTIADLGSTFEYTFNLPFGATYHQDVLEVTAFIDNKIDRLFDNNIPFGNALLNSRNNWYYSNHTCN
jgi:hypothetical protein